MASKEELNFNAPHPPKETSIEAFNLLLPTLKSEILKSRHHWDKHEPRMWSRVAGVSDNDLTSFTIENDLVEVRSAATSYGTIILGKIRVVNDNQGEGFVHVRIHDPPNRGNEDVRFHSIFTNEIRPDPEAPPTDFCAIQTREYPLEFFNE
ncbi:hypothetical protein CPC08DRAFT_680317 [Agrocybe pediades]|nr:hypothetical protein CPC08DRAFT_680317 [Agrocybe pediades]